MVSIPITWRLAGNPRNIRPYWQADAELGRGSVQAIVLQKSLADIARRDSDDCILSCVIG